MAKKIENLCSSNSKTLKVRGKNNCKIFEVFLGFLKNLKFVRQIYSKCLKNGSKIQVFLRNLEDFCMRVDLKKSQSLRLTILRLMVNLMPLFPPQILRVILENSQISR